MRRTGGLAFLAGALVVLAACESDELSPVSEFTGTDCQDITNCGEGSFKLDSGVTTPPTDAGAADSGADTDGGVTPDAGFVDGGVVPRDGGPRDGGVVPSPFLNLTGTHQTDYLFDLSDYAFGLGGIASELDRINQLLMGNAGINPVIDAILRPILLSVINQYVPAWFLEFFDTLNNIANLFTEVEADAVLNLGQDPPVAPTDLTTVIRGNEAWSAFYLRWIDQCPQGRMTTSPVPYPQCARIPIPIRNSPTPIGVGNGGIEVSVYIAPFDGTLNAGVPEADFVLEDREIELEMRKFVLLVLDTVTNIITGGNPPTFRQALQNVVNCPGLVSNVSDPVARAALQTVCIGIINGAVDRIANVATDVDALRFDQYGHAVDTNPQDGQNRAEILQTMSTPNTIDGRFRLIGSSDLGGRWSGQR